MWVTAHGVKTQYQRMGSGPVLVMLHGWGCDWQIWSPVMAALSESFELILPDLPAFGQSEANDAWETPDYADWLADFIAQTIKNKPFSLVGHSFGGKIAAIFAATHQSSHLQKLILVDASGMPAHISPLKQLQKIVLGVIPTQLKDRIPVPLKQTLLRITGSASDYFSSSPSQRQLFQRIYQQDIPTLVRKVSVPTLLLWGAQDQDTPLDHAKKFAAAIPNATLTVFEHSGHFPFVDQPTEFVASLQEFVNE